MNEETAVRCPLCQTVLAPCECKKNPAPGFEECCIGHVWVRDEFFKIERTIGLVAQAFVDEVDCLYDEAVDIARAVWGRVTERDCDRIHHVVLSGQYDIDPSRYTPRIETAGLKLPLIDGYDEEEVTA